jgi:type IV secretion system protein TrbL
VKLFVLYLIIGVGMGIAARWMPVLDRGGFSPIPFFYVMGGSVVFVFLTWHIPSVAGSMMAGAVSLSLSDAVYPAMLGSRAAGAGLVTAGAVGAAAVGGLRWGIDWLAGMAHRTQAAAGGGYQAEAARRRAVPGQGRHDSCFYVLSRYFRARLKAMPPPHCFSAASRIRATFSWKFPNR